MKKKIGIDIDDTLTNLHEIFLSYGFDFINRWNINIKNINLYGYEAIDTFNFTAKENNKFKKEYLEKMLMQAHPRPLAKEVINELSTEYYIYIITSRDKKLIKNCKNKTIDWLKSNDIFYNKLIFNCKDKVEFCKKNNILMIVDDNPRTCKKSADKGITTFLFDNPYNRNFNNSKVKRIYSWGELKYEMVLEEQKVIKALPLAQFIDKS